MYTTPANGRICQIRHFISLFIQYASWNPSKNVSYLNNNNNIHHILKQIWIGFKQILPVYHWQRKLLYTV